MNCPGCESWHKNYTYVCACDCHNEVNDLHGQIAKLKEEIEELNKKLKDAVGDALYIGALEKQVAELKTEIEDEQ